MFAGEMLCFLPVLYTWLRSRRSAIKLAPSPAADDEDLTGLPSKMLPLTGRRVFLMWLPALCDLTGTTVRSPEASAESPI